MRAHRHQHDDSHERISADSVNFADVLAAEMLSILDAVGNAHRRAVDGVERQPFPAVTVRAAIGPFLAGAQKQPLHRLRTDSRTRLSQRARSYGPAAIRPGKREL